MEAIEFVVRDRAGNIRKGAVSQDDAAGTIFVNSGDDISLNLRRFQVQGYERAGDAMIVTLADGRKIRLEGFFATDANFYISSDGSLTEVDVATASEGAIDPQYADARIFGKYSPDDALFYVDGPDLGDAVASTGDDEAATMLAAPILAGLGGLGGAGAGLGVAAAAVGGAALIGGGGGGGGGPVPDTTAPDVALDSGVVSVDHVFDAADQADGIEIGGSGESGVDIKVEINGEYQETTVDDDGTWNVVFDPTQVPEGEYDVDVTVTATDAAGNAATVTDVVRVDTVTQVSIATIDGAATGSGDVINAVEHADGVTLTGTGEVGAQVVVTLSENGATANGVVGENGEWSVDFTPVQVAIGEYSSDVTVTSTDAYGNSATAVATMVVDTVASVSITGNNAGADGVYNGAEAADPAILNGTAQPGSTVVVSLTGPAGQALGTQTVTATASGAWTAKYPGGSLPDGEYDVTVNAVATDVSGNTETTSATIPVDTLTRVDIAQVDGHPAAGPHVINASSHADGVTMSGTGEPGGALSVAIAGGGSVTSVVGDDGTWQVNFMSSQVPTGETTADVAVSIVDAAGNTDSTTAVMMIDTQTDVAITGNNTGADNVMNLVESASGTIVTGTAQAGASVIVTLTDAAGAALGAQTVLANGAGQWTAKYAPGALPMGEYDVTVAAVATDAAGNTASSSSGFAVDTVANVSVATETVEGDNVINIVEAQDGVEITGTADANAMVDVSFGGAQRMALSDANGNWSTTFAAGDIPAGTETTVPVEATYTDAAGNVAVASGTVDVDTIVRNLSVDPVTGDGVVDAAEAATGFTLTGTTEPGAQSVMVGFHALPARAATMQPDGTWAITFGPGEVPQGEYSSLVTVTTVDRNSNTDTVTTPVQVDTNVPDAPLVISYTEYTRGDPGVSGVGTELTDDIVAISKVSAAGAVGDVAYTTSQLAAIPGVRDGELQFAFSERIPDGSNLVINAADAVGNQSATLVVLDDNAVGAVQVTTTGLQGFDIAAIDLSIVAESELTLSASDLTSLSNDTNALIIHGDANDVINVAGAQTTGQTEQIGGKTYDIYTLGDDGSLIIEQDVTVNY